MKYLFLLLISRLTFLTCKVLSFRNPANRKSLPKPDIYEMTYERKSNNSRKESSYSNDVRRLKKDSVKYGIMAQDASKIKDFDLGWEQTCVINTFGRVYCWGYNKEGELGAGKGGNINLASPDLPAVDLGAGVLSKELHAGKNFVCALLETDDVKCWGEGRFGQLGNGANGNVGLSSATMGDNLKVIDFGQGRKVKKMACGDVHSCVILDDGSLKCFGRNHFGQLGYFDAASIGSIAGQMGDNLPIVDFGGVGVVDISAGQSHTCALLDNGIAKCWGSNTYGELGQGDKIARGGSIDYLVKNIPPLDVGGNIKKVLAGFSNSCAILTDGRLKCWGLNGGGKNGLGNAVNYGDNANEMGDFLPNVDLGTSLAAKTIDSSYFTCASISDNTAKCWGWNSACALGAGISGGYVGNLAGQMGNNLLPVNLKSGAEVENVKVGSFHACAHLKDKTLQCWGLNRFGQVGAGHLNNIGCATDDMGDNLASTVINVCDQTYIELELSTDSNPEHTSWYLKNLASDDFVMQTRTGSYSLPQINEYEFCEPHGTFEFKVEHNLGEWYGDYKLSVNNRVILQQNITGYFYEDKILFSSCEDDIHCNDQDPCTNDVCNIDDGICSFTLFYSLDCRSFGRPSTLVIRGESLDSSLTTSREDLSDSFFGTFGGSFNMKSQFSSCSYNQFNMTQTPIVDDGVIDVKINEESNGKATGYVVAKLYEIAEIELGELTSQFDFVIICVQPGTLLGDAVDWKAYAFIHSFLSIYNDLNCIYPSVQMHEIGHNLGLSHSNDEANYGDHSGMMGVSFTLTDGPIKCFNAPKSYQLLWYRESYLVMDINDILNKEVQLVGVSDFDNRGFKSTHMKIINCENGFDYYLSFNRNTGMNSGTSEGVNELLVTERKIGSFYQNSYLIARLGHQQLFTIYDLGFDGSLNLHIRPQIYLNSYPSYARISFETWSKACYSDTDCDDNSLCTIDTCMNDSGNGICLNTPKSCDECGASISIFLKTNEFPDELVWSIQNTVTNKIVKSSIDYSYAYYSYNYSECFSYGNYKFILSYDGNTTHFNQSASYNISVGNETIDYGHITELLTTETTFTICSTNTDCIDYDGCTWDICNTHTKLCNNTQVLSEEDCSSCTWFMLNITTDNYQDETSWIIRDYNTDALVFSGDPYPLEAVLGNGRRKAPTKSGRRKAPTRASSSTKHSNHFTTLEDNENKIFKRICLEKYIKFYFMIADSFGDGICCAEGEGSYALTFESKKVKEGGDFAYQEDVYFKFSNSADECEDNDLGMMYEFDSDTSTCLYHPINCDDYGALVTVLIKTDIYADDTRWTIKGSEIVMEGAFYALAYNDYSTIKCLPYGSYLFSIIDTFADGMAYCFDEVCGFSLRVNDEIIFESDGSFGSKTKAIFGICIADNECDDNDSCTMDSCDTENRICKYEKLPCSACNKETVVIDVNTDFLFSLTAWSIKNMKTNTTLISDGPFVKKYTHYQRKFCLADGFYSFLISNSEGRGMTICKDDSCGYEISVNNNTIIQSDGSFGYEHEDNFVICYYDYQCDDMDSCTIDSCDLESKTCTNMQLSCSECSKKTISIYVSTDGKAMETSWFIYNLTDQKTLKSGGNFARNYSNYEETYCLSTGTYEFKILDSKGDGMTSCIQENKTCGYSLIVNDITVVENDGSFMFEDVYLFGFCSNDDQCDDGDECTVDSCDTTINTCNYELLCSVCGKEVITINIDTDKNSAETSWSISNLNKDSTLISGGPYAQSYTYYNYSYCLAGGEYSLSFFDSGANGFQNCSDFTLGIHLAVNGTIIIASDGNFECSQSYLFKINSTYTLPPSISLSPTLAPTNTSYLMHSKIIDFAVGYYHTCALTSAGFVFCFGKNSFGQLGYGDKIDRSETGINFPSVDLGKRSAKEIYAGGFHTCAVLDTNDLVCWGNNDAGQLGYESKVNKGSSFAQMGEYLNKVNLGVGRKIKKVSLGFKHSCVILDNNELKCFGYNEFGQLGYEHTYNIGDNENELGDKLRQVDLGDDKICLDVSAGTYHTCAVLQGGLKCFGDNSFSQLGYGDLQNRGERMYSMGLNLPFSTGTIKEVSAGNSATCVIYIDGKAKCWGYNLFSQLGYGDKNDRGGNLADLPYINIGSDKNFRMITQTSYSTCALTTEGDVKCWGSNLECSLGVGNNANPLGSLVMGDELPIVDLGRKVEKLKMSNWHVCILDHESNLYCWGSNRFGELGQKYSQKIGCKNEEMGSNLNPIKLYDPITWALELDKIHSKKGIDDIILSYNISKRIKPGQFISSIYDHTCEVKSNELTVTIGDIELRLQSNETLDRAFVSIKVNYTEIRSSSFWTHTSNTTGILSFCVRSQILLSEYSIISVSFTNTIVSSKLDFNGNFNITDISMGKISASKVFQAEKIEVSACICNEENACIQNPTLYQNSEISICVKTIDNTLQVKLFETMSFYQDGILKMKSVENGEDSEITTSVPGNVGVSKTRLISAFFASPTPTNIVIFGSVLLEFKNKRLLYENTDQANEGDLEGSFEVEVTLTTSTFLRFENFLVGWTFFLCALVLKKIFQKKKYASYEAIPMDDL